MFFSQLLLGAKGRSYALMHKSSGENRAFEVIAGKHAVPDVLSWYALTTRSRHELVASMTLESLGITHFVPVINEERRWSDRKKLIKVPLFPGYLFVRAALTSGVQLKIRKVRGIVDFVGNHSGPLAVPDKEIESIQTLISRGADCSPHPVLAVGERVRVMRGSLAGVEGILIRHGSHSRIVVSVEIIHRAVSINVAAADVERISEMQTPHSRVA
jgi:transcription termination/antitermination protein NusG